MNWPEGRTTRVRWPWPVHLVRFCALIFAVELLALTPVLLTVLFTDGPATLLHLSKATYTEGFVAALGASSLLLLVELYVLNVKAGFAPWQFILLWVPFYGGFFATRIFWRVASLPVRYWEYGSMPRKRSSTAVRERRPPLSSAPDVEGIGMSETRADDPRIVRP